MQKKIQIFFLLFAYLLHVYYKLVFNTLIDEDII